MNSNKHNQSEDELMRRLQLEDEEDFLMLQLMREQKGEETISAAEFREEIKEWKSSDCPQ